MNAETLPAEDMEAAQLNAMIGDTVVQQGCEECGKLIVYRGRNRLSNCGHMRRSHGTWIPAKSRPEKPKPAPPGVLADGQWARINVLANLREQARLSQFQAEENYKRAAAEFDDYMSTIRFKRDV